MNLETIRNEIDEVDIKLADLLIKRMNCSKEIAIIKKEDNLPIFIPEREKEILEKLKNLDENYGDYLCDIYKTVFEVSRDLQFSVLSSEDSE